MLFALAQELASLYFLLPKFQSKLIVFLTDLCCCEETVIRDQAVKSLDLISQKMSPAEIQDQLVPIVNKVGFLNSFWIWKPSLPVELWVSNFWSSSIPRFRVRKPNCLTSFATWPATKLLWLSDSSLKDLL